MSGHYWANTQYFNPKQIGGLVLWLDATDPSANGVVPANNSAIATWKDKSTAGNDVTQATGANQPTFKTNTLNSKPVVQFNGSTTNLQKATVTSLGNTCTIFVAGTIRTNGSSIGAYLEYSNGASSNTGCILFYEVTQFIWRVVVGGVAKNCNFVTSLPYSNVSTGNNTGTNSFLFVNGTQQATTASGNTDATNRLTIGTLAAMPGAYFLNGDIGEILVYNASISSAQRTLVTRYLGNKWGYVVA